MKLLELFAGTGSIGRAFAEQGWEVTSLDIDPKSEATLITDFTLWKYWEIPKGHFDAIWASPVCTMYSCARTTGKTPRDLEGSDHMVQRVLDCISYFEPTVWAFENPQTGLLKDRAVVAGVPYKDISYCMYGYPYRKPTRIWTNSVRWEPRPMCTKKAPCPMVVDGRHPMTAQRGPSRSKLREMSREDRCSLRQLYSMPEALCTELALAFSLEVDGSVRYGREAETET
jgi:hypothetical protein